MPRPFAVIGYTMFFVMLILYYAGVGSALPVGLFFLLSLLVAFAVPRFRQQRVVPLLMASGVIACVLFAFAYKMDYEPALILDGNTVQAEIKMKDEVQLRNGRYYCAGETVTVNGKPYKLKVRLSLNERPEAGAYDTVSGDFVLMKQNTDSSAALPLNADSGSCLDAFPAGYSDAGLTYHQTPAAKKPVRLRFLQLRDTLNSALKSAIPGERGELCSALLFGKSDTFPESLRVSFNAVGVSHIVCVSGLHLSVWALGAYGVLRKLRVKRRVASLAAIGFILCYAAITAFPPSVIRAGVMLSVVMAGKVFRRRGDAFNSLGIAAVMMLVQNPFSVADMGFSLSFLSTLGILLFSAKLQSAVMKPFENRVPSFLKKAIGYPVGVITVTASAMVLTMPLMLLNFGSVHLIGFIGNLLLLPAVSCCMVTAGFTAVFSCIPFMGWLSSALGFVSGLFSRYMIVIVKALSGIKFISLSPVTEAACFWIGFSATLFIIAWHFITAYPWAKKATAWAIVICFALVNAGSLYESQYATELRVIGAGNATAVLLKKGGRAVLLGCGRDGKASLYAVTDALEDARIGYLDLMVLPTAELADSGNAAYVLQRIHTDELAFDRGFLSLKNQLKNTECVSLRGTMRRTLWRDCSLTVTVGSGGTYAVVDTCGIKTLIVFGPSFSDFEAVKADFLVMRAGSEVLDGSTYRAVLVSGSENNSNLGDCEYKEILFTEGENDIRLRMRPGGKFQLVTNG